MATQTHQYASMQHSPFLSGSAGKTSRTIPLDIEAANLTAGSRFNFILLPPDAVVTNVYLAADELDVDATETLTLNIKAENEDGTETVTLLSASDVAQDGGVVEAGSNLPILTRDQNYYLFVDVQAGAEEAQEGNMRLLVEWFRSRED